MTENNDALSVSDDPRRAEILRHLDGFAAAPAPLNAGERAGFRQRLFGLLQKHGVDAMLIEPGGTLEYLTGVAFHASERLLAAAALSDGTFLWVSPAFEAGRVTTLCERASGSSELTAHVLPWDEHEDSAKIFADALKAKGLGKNVVADPDVRARFTAPIGAHLGTPVGDGSAIARELRGPKCAREIEIMRSAQERTQAAIRAVFAVTEPGMRSTEVGALAHFAQKSLGLTGTWDLSLAGPSGAFPHGDEVDRVLEKGSVMLLDTGGKLHGYCSDTTRTWVVDAAPSDEVQKVWDAVRAAQIAGTEAMGVGKRTGDADKAARTALAKHGYDGGYAHLSHRLGHGIGVQIHEPPYLDGGSDVLMEPGMCFTNEPGIYLPGRFGLRIEDICIITESGVDHFGEWQKGPSAP
ncbi:Xaa-Pro dipeptidase [Planctomycetes bacterium Poly30]|uniref:Xaa-Pro dipeptidase n=1 Tax=Saltatorellus ferox TaxID=2528018 RepID=A0A518EVA2_9BACT|nr:Xaa-Pro dipeptidase [Planctomycetes bacterium Poly30]